MITAHSIVLLIEEYFDTKRIGGNPVTIYKNPNLDDIKEFPTDFIRFLADAKTKNVYVWDGYGAIHFEMWSKIFGNITPSKIRNFPNILPGKAMRDSKKLKMIGWDGINSYLKEYNQLLPKIRLEMKDYFQQLFSYNWLWLDSYVIGASKYIFQEKLKLKD